MRLQHITRKGAVIRDALTSRPPWKVRDRMYLGDAVVAASYHILRHEGITHVLNMTKVWKGGRGGGYCWGCFALVGGVVLW